MHIQVEIVYIVSLCIVEEEYSNHSALKQILFSSWH